MKLGKNLVVFSIVFPAALLVGCAAPPLHGEVLPRSDRYRLEPASSGTIAGVQLTARLEKHASARFPLQKDAGVRSVAWIETDQAGVEASTDVAPWDWFSAVAISPDGKYAAVAGRHGTRDWGLGVYEVDVDAREGEAATTLKLNHVVGDEWFWRGRVESLCFATDGRVLTWTGQGDDGSAALHTAYVKRCAEGKPVLELPAIATEADCPTGHWVHAVTPEIGGRVGYLTSPLPDEVGEIRFQSTQPWKPLAEVQGPQTTADWTPGAADACVGVAQSPRGPARVAVGTKSGVRLISLSPKSQMDQALPVGGVVAPPVWLRSRPLHGRDDLLALVSYDAARFGHDIQVVRIRGEAGQSELGVDTVKDIDCSDDLCPAFYRDDSGRLGGKGGVWLVFASNAVDETSDQQAGWRLLLHPLDASPAAESGPASTDAALSPR